MTRHNLRLFALSLAILAGFALHHVETDNIARCTTCETTPAAL
ncbi:hypothetical protein [Jannaschia pohangensis]|uniref:Uncharacterized protein n=1 Tax=Jannaschia pohangensis TaxID=390807 RepID=A0A1I3U5I0_9RHOB|nr:hypothetical protein [Jannaschia pohangensis]SFJ78270.1 hypothetical protein SAMN04488095_3638 [Jannaschia pohangensis]